MWFYLYCWSVNLVSLNGSDFITVETTKKMKPLIDKIQFRILREADKKYIYICVVYSYFFFLKKSEYISGIRPCFDQLPFLLIQLSENDNCLACKIWGSVIDKV